MLSHTQVLEVKTESQRGEPCAPALMARWGHKLGFSPKPVKTPEPTHWPRKEGRGQREASKDGRAAPGHGAGWELLAGSPSVPLPPFPLGAPALSSNGLCQAVVSPSPPGPGEPLRAKQGCPAPGVQARALGKEHTLGSPRPKLKFHFCHPPAV